MPAQSQQQQKLFGLALAVKRGEVSPSEVSDEVNAIVDRMSEKDIEDFAGTSHKGLPKKVEQQMREMVREIMRERVISELNEDGKMQGGEDDPCWKGYEMVGMKMKDGKEVPNCVPKNESVNEALGNDKAMLALVDMLSNSMEHYASANEFVNITSKIPGFANYKSELKHIRAVDLLQLEFKEYFEPYILDRFLKYQMEFETISINEYEKKYEEQQVKYFKKKAAKLGFQLVPA